MIIIDNLRNISKHPEYEHWLIVRSLSHPIANAQQVDILSPSKELFLKYNNVWKKNGTWGPQIFAEEYVPIFISEMKHNSEAIALLDTLYKRSKNEDIALYCFCPDETLCHRSVVAGMLLGAGANIACSENYKKYWNMFREA